MLVVVVEDPGAQQRFGGGAVLDAAQVLRDPRIGVEPGQDVEVVEREAAQRQPLGLQPG